MTERKDRTPLAHVTGLETRRGDPAEAARLADCLRLTPEDQEVAIAGIHGLHAYPARMHPLWARRLIEALPRDASILDPFCGSGTVLVEARRAGIYSRGSDINPIAVRLARLRCIPPPDPSIVRREADRCASRCTERRETPFSALAEGESEFPKHVLAGLISLRDEIEQTEDRKTHELLLFCLSPLLDKLSARRDRPAPRVSRTAVRDHFLERVERWLAYFEQMRGRPWAEVEIADARRLPWKLGSSSAVITSPPYPGISPYAAAQERRTRWLGDPQDLLRAARRKEIGRHDAADWTEGMSWALDQMCRVTKPASPIYIVVGDGAAAGKVVRADREIEEIAARLPLELVAVASQDRPHFHKPTAAAFEKRPRREHLMMLRRRQASEQGNGASRPSRAR